MTPQQVRLRLAAACVGVALAGVGVAAVFCAWPSQGSVDGSKEYGYVYSGAKSSSVDFIRASYTDDTLVVFGSSEFSTPSSVVPQVPSQVFGQNNYGVDLMLVGEAYDQSLWHTIALGALAKDQGLPRQKAVLIVSPGWFTDGGLDTDTFKTRFSYSLYQAFCQNESISQETRDYVASRLEQMGIDDTQLQAAEGELPQDKLNNIVFNAFEDLSLRNELQQVRQKGTDKNTDEETSPDWETMRSEALEYAQTRSTNNDWGVEDGFYSKQLAPALDSVKDSRSSETYSDTAEYDDLAAFLQVANDCGVEVMVVISPVLGQYYDYIGISAETRQGCYEHIRQVCEQAGATVCDFSDREYEQYWLYDIVHFGWTGWIDLNQAIYEFAKGDDE
jgi:D-alanine transfer protein